MPCLRRPRSHPIQRYTKLYSTKALRERACGDTSVDELVASVAARPFWGNARYIASTKPGIINSRDESGDLAIVQAAEHGFTSMIEVLIWFGAKVNGVDGGGDTALLRAISVGKTSTVSKLLQYGADPNQSNRDDTPLALAISARKLDIVSLLLQYGADPNKVTGEQEHALCCTLQLSDDDALPMVKILLEVGALVDPDTFNSTVHDGRRSLIELMLNSPSINLAEPVNDEALDNAITKGDPAVIDLIVNALTPRQKSVYAEQARAEIKNIEKIGKGCFDDFKLPYEATLRALGVQ